MITEQQVEDAKKEFISIMTGNIVKEGKSNPVFALIVEDQQNTIPGIMVFPLPAGLFHNQTTKQLLIDRVLPEVKREVVKKQGYKALASCFMMEANMWIKLKDQGDSLSDDEIDDIRKASAPTDIVMFSFEDKYNESLTIYEVARKSVITPTGDLKEETELTLRPELAMNDNNEVVVKGMFTGLFKIFWEAE